MVLLQRGLKIKIKKKKKKKKNEYTSVCRTGAPFMYSARIPSTI
jgi:hypothetical protein